MFGRDAIRAFPLVALLAAAPALAGGLTPISQVETRGKGPVALVLVPGLMCDWTVWQGFMERNASKYTMIAVTLPGFGGTSAPAREEAPEGTPWLDNAVAAVAKVIADQKLKDPVLIGHSMGGLVALRVASEKPGLVAKVVTVDGPPALPLGPGFAGGKRAEMIEKTVAGLMRSLSDEQWATQRSTMFASMVSDQSRSKALGEMAAKTARETAVEYYIELLKSDATEGVGKITAPALAMAAVDGSPGAIPEDTRKRWTEQFSKASKGKVVFFESTKHFIMDDRPQVFDAAVEAFVAGKDVQGYTAPVTAPAPAGAPAPGAGDKPVDPKPAGKPADGKPGGH